MGAITSQIISLTTAYSIAYSGADQRKHQGCASLAFVRGIHRWPVNSPHNGPVTRKMFTFDDVINDQNMVFLSIEGNLPWLQQKIRHHTPCKCNEKDVNLIEKNSIGVAPL